MFLLGVLLVGALALMATLALLMLSWNDELNGVRFASNSQSQELARSCMDVAILKLRKTPGYIGNEEITFPTGTCQILTIQGAGASSRTICTKGISGTTSKMLLSVFTQLYAQTKISTYREPTSLKECGGSNALP